MSTETILEVADAVKDFDGLRAVDGASFSVERGSITALIGPNGAGKTTMFDLLSGFARLDSGAIRFAGRSIGGMAPHRIAQLGMVRTFQLTRVLAGMSVIDNMLLAAPRQPGEHLISLLVGPGRARAAEATSRARAAGLLETFGLRDKAQDYAGALSGGQRKLLEIARALMTEPSMVLLDEPMAGVNPTLGRAILDHIAALREQRGTTFLFVEHDMDIVMSRADRVVVMAQGRVISAGTPAQVRADPGVVEAYLGSPSPEAAA
ncbi:MULTISPECIES: ABC transporter ATP-binding protein [unclassified Mesorhizobium]|uniref:ABC transporter ATP-binding protein n=1 Tax=unclassified Mesorhizobium TaxID=325217 RepID=UPI00112BA64E|nr:MULTISPECIES: ABC transporter ATP-binding protein [unclassified Mesorhizobium]TPM94756.1 ABC transporter ATP-binding protein [Mesorhizobium sp. B2-1-3A]BCG86816.1 ABC transporter ATP-binding protein [Mesorhizobium sp. 113-3-9]